MKRLLWTACCALMLQNALAQEASTSQSITKEQAQTTLNQLLFSSKVAPVHDINSVVIDSTLRLQSHVAAGFTSLQTVIEPMQTLGLQAACKTQCEDRNSVIQSLNRLINRDFGTGVVILAAENGPKNFDLFADFIDPNCSTEATPHCGRAVAAATDLWHIAGSYRAFANSLNTDYKIASRATLSSLDQQWKSYNDDTIKLWPQEVLLSSLFFKPQTEGFAAPPNFKILSMRPSLGLSYLSDGSPDFRPTLNIDLLGVYWWRYQDNKASPGRGLSTSLLWDGDDTAYGITYHHNPKWSMTLAHSDDNDVVLSVSFQLAYWLLK